MIFRFALEYSLSPKRFKFTKDVVISASVFALLLFYNLADNFAPRGVFFWREVYAFTYLGLLLISMIVLFNFRDAKTLPATYFIITLLLMATGLVSLFPDISWPIKYIVGDFAIISMFFIFGIIIRPVVSVLKESNIIFLACIFLMLSLVSYSVMYFQLNQNYLHGNRFDSPHVFSVSAIAALILSCDGLKRFCFYVLFFFTGVLAVICQWRAEILFFLIGFFPILLTFFFRIRFLFFTVIFLLAIFIVVYADFIWMSFLNSVDSSRFSELANTGKDTSFLNRLLEVQDVFLVITEERSVLKWLFGFGHGALYPTVFSYPEPNVTYGGGVHNIHINAFLWLFRYGLFGLAVYLFFVIKVIREYLCFLKDTNKYSITEGMFVISAMMLVVKSFFYTPINDPINSLLIVGFIYVSWKRNKQSIKYAERRFDVSWLLISNSGRKIF